MWIGRGLGADATCSGFSVQLFPISLSSVGHAGEKWGGEGVVGKGLPRFGVFY